MTTLWLTLAAVFMFALTARYFSTSSITIPASVSPNKIFVLLTALVISMVSGLRNNIGDTYFYMHSFIISDFSWSSILQQRDIGFNIFEKILKSYTDDPQILILVTALITNVLIVMVLYKYSRLFELGIYIYITSGAFIVSMNGIRQYLAAAIVFAATKYVFNGSWRRYIAVVLFASVFHQSALIMIPIYFIVRREAWTRTTYFLLSVAVLIVFGFNQFSSILFSALKDTQYGEYQSFSEGGANIIRVVFYGLPLVIAFLGRIKLRNLFPKIDIVVNLSLIGLVLMMISTQNWIFARLAIYFSLYQILLYSWIIKAFRKKDQKLIYIIILIVYFIYSFYENVLMLDIRYQSDYLTWFL
ncbi:EpsG family protein [Paenibacillus sp. BR2-3]|uniref:EpsG family protein n=1 Tax=Paenibacillus sp. BR2-3 TaxID=3048494 RepID=UPI003977CCD2